MKFSDYSQRPPQQQLADEDLEFYRSRPKPPEGWPRRDTPDAVLRALNHAHDDLRKQERINKSVVAQLDSVQSELLSTKEQLREKKLKLWVMTFVAFGLWELLKFAAELILKH